MATSATASATPNAAESAFRETPRTRRVTGRAMSVRSTNSPMALMNERKTTQRATRSCVVVAVSLSDGTRNWGGGPGFGPTANVNAPRTGWPSAEMTRQKTRYQPSGTRSSGVTRVCRLAGGASGGAGRHLPALGVGHRDDREARLDRLAVGQPDVRRRVVDRAARDRRGAEQRRVRPGGGGHGQRHASAAASAITARRLTPGRAPW